MRSCPGAITRPQRCSPWKILTKDEVDLEGKWGLCPDRYFTLAPQSFNHWLDRCTWSNFKRILVEIPSAGQVCDGNKANYKKLICFIHKIFYPPTQPTLWLPRTRIDSLCKTSRKVVRGQICRGRKENVPTRAAGGGKREEEMTGKLATPRKCPQAHPSPKSQNRTAEILWIQANCPTFIAT